jgi:hypothetical protein
LRKTLHRKDNNSRNLTQVVVIDTMAAATTEPAKEDTSKPHDADSELDKDLESISLGDNSAAKDNNKDNEDHALLSDDDEDLIIEAPHKSE